MKEAERFLFETLGLLLWPFWVALAEIGCGGGCGDGHAPFSLAIVPDKVEQTPRPLGMVGNQCKGRVRKALPV